MKTSWSVMPLTYYTCVCSFPAQCQGGCSDHTAGVGGADWDEGMAGGRRSVRGAEEGESLPTTGGEHRCCHVLSGCDMN